jgi:hypothetical protein
MRWHYHTEVGNSLLTSPIPGPPKTRMSSLDEPPLSLIGMMLQSNNQHLHCSHKRIALRHTSSKNNPYLPQPSQIHRRGNWQRFLPRAQQYAADSFSQLTTLSKLQVERRSTHSIKNVRNDGSFIEGDESAQI